MKNYKIKGIELNEYDMQLIKEYYEYQNRMDMLLFDYDITEEEAGKLSAKIGKYMRDYDMTEREAMNEILKNM